jgi:hypothetical protein
MCRNDDTSIVKKIHKNRKQWQLPEGGDTTGGEDGNTGGLLGLREDPCPINTGDTINLSIRDLVTIGDLVTMGDLVTIGGLNLFAACFC